MTIDGFDLTAWAGRARLVSVGRGEHDLEAFSDMEVTLFLTEVDGAYVVQSTDRGRTRRTRASFSARDDAYRYLVMLVGEDLAYETRRPRPRPDGVAPGSRLDGDTLVWDGRSATFARSADASAFSWYATRPLSEIAAAYGP